MDMTSKNIVVTGGAGFLGTAVVNKLKQFGCQDIFIVRSKDFNLINAREVVDLYEIFEPDIVIHLAATVGGIAVHKDHPAIMFYNNAVMGLQMMEQAWLSGVEKFVIFGTTCVYPEKCPIPMKEEDIWNGYPNEVTGPYGIAKRMLIEQSRTYRKEYGFNSICLMPVNLYGPHDHFDAYSSHVIPALIKKVWEAKNKGDKNIEVWGSGKASREFLYVDDCAEAILLAILKYDKSEPVNIGSGIDTTIKELVEMICEVMNYHGNIYWNTSMPDGQLHKNVDTSKAEREFGFKATTSLKDGLQKTIDWYIKSLCEKVAI